MLIADEPTSQLDIAATIGVAGLLRKLVEEVLGALVVVHDLALAAATADRVVVVHDGRTEAAGCRPMSSPRSGCDGSGAPRPG